MNIRTVTKNYHLLKSKLLYIMSSGFFTCIIILDKEVMTCHSTKEDEAIPMKEKTFGRRRESMRFLCG